MFFFFKQKTAYEMRISDWSSDVCSSDLMRRRSLMPVRRNRANGEPDKRSAAHACRNRKSVPTFRRKKERRAPWDGQAALRLSCPPLRRHSPCLLLAVSIASKVRRLAKKLHL